MDKPNESEVQKDKSILELVNEMAALADEILNTKGSRNDRKHITS